MSDLIIGTRKVAKIIDVSPQTIYRWCEAGMPFQQLVNGKRGYNVEAIKKWLVGQQ